MIFKIEYHQETLLNPMTNTVLKAFVLCLLMLLYSQASHAQKVGSVNINVNARVIESIELITLKNMEFGQVQPGNKTLYISPIEDETAGKMLARGIPNARIKVSYFKEWELTSDRSDKKLQFFYEVAGNTEDNQATAELLLADNRELQLNEEGAYYFWIGGRTNVTEAEPGNYEGEFTIEIEYM